MTAKAFTLIELLVVVTIIVVLLALLMPAMDKAIYQAELVQCGGKLKAVGSAVTTYAFGNRRTYPDRGLQQRTDQSQLLWIAVFTLANPSEGYDMRPGLEGVLSVNEMLQCPFVEPVELEQPTVGGVLTSYNPWWGWKYHTSGRGAEAGMFKLGDRFAWGGQKYSTLASDIDLLYPEAIQSSHPDRDPATMSPVRYQEPPPGETGDPNRDDLFLTVSTWSVTRSEVQSRRGLIDMNHLFDDLSVSRYDGVKGWNPRDERMDAVPAQMTDPRPGDRVQIPKR